MSLEPKEEPTRVERYLSHILANPDRWIRINKQSKKGAVYSANESHNERLQVVEDIKVALDLMGIKYQMKKNTSYIIRIVTKTYSGGYITYDTNKGSMSVYDKFDNLKVKLAAY